MVLFSGDVVVLDIDLKTSLVFFDKVGESRILVEWK